MWCRLACLKVSSCGVTDSRITITFSALIKHILHLGTIIHDIRAEHGQHYRIWNVGASPLIGHGCICITESHLMVAKRSKVSNILLVGMVSYETYEDLCPVCVLYLKQWCLVVENWELCSLEWRQLIDLIRLIDEQTETKSKNATLVSNSSKCRSRNFQNLGEGLKKAPHKKFYLNVS
jgi:hypothetical protein